MSAHSAATSENTGSRPIAEARAADSLQTRARLRSRGPWARFAVGALGAGALFWASGCFSSGSSGGLAGDASSPTADGSVVAILDTTAPGRPQFILRGTVPVPPGTFPRTDGKVPFTVLDWDGTPVPTQLEVVTRYPKDADGADVVEVLARVSRNPNAAPNAAVSYEVIQDLHDPKNIFVDQGVLGLMNTPGSVLMVARDVFGNVYGADLAQDLRPHLGNQQLTMMREGEVAMQMRTHHVLQPTSAVGPPSGALPHFFGVHSYFTAWRGEDVMSLDLRVHNGFSGKLQNTPLDDPLEKVYFASLELWVPSGWTALAATPDPLFGPVIPSPQGNWNIIPIVRARGDGKMHVMPHQAQFNRRLVLAPVGCENKAQFFLDERSVAFCRRGTSPTGGELYSWWNPNTRRYFPQRYALPDLDYLGIDTVRGRLGSTFSNVRGVLLSGNAGQFPTQTPALGWAQPWGVPYGGMTGGPEIFITDGVQTAASGSRAGYRLAQLTHRMYACREPVTIFNADGSPVTLSDWIVHGPNFDYVNMWFFLRLLPGNDPFGFNATPQFQRNHVQAQNLAPGYEAALLNFAPIDFQHYVRYTRSPKKLIWLGNDALAKDDMLMAGELVRMSFHHMPNNASGATIVSGGAFRRNFVDSHPGVGFPYGRGEGWGLDAMNTAFSIADVAWRTEARPWFGFVSDLVADGQASCSGFIQAFVNDKLFGGNYRARQSIEQAITENAMRGMVESVFRGVDSARRAQTEYIMERSFYAMVGPMAWVDAWHGPANYVAVAPLPLSQPPYCGSTPNGGQAAGADKYQNWNSFAYAFELTGDQIFLTRATEMAGGGDLLQRLQSTYFNNLENRAGLLALAQGY